MMMGKKCKGGLLLVLGIFFALGTFNIVPQITLGQYWPLILVLVGIHDLFCGCKGGMGMGGCSCGCGCSACGMKDGMKMRK